VTQVDVLHHYRGILAKNPSSFVFVSMASECLRFGKKKLALDVLEKGLRRHPKLGSALTLKGRALAALGRTDEAREILTRVVESDPENLLAKRMLAGFPPAPLAKEIEPAPAEEIIIEPEAEATHEPEVIMLSEAGPEAPILETVDEPATVETQTPVLTDEEAATPRDTRTVETLEKWLNNATRMMKG
jgi:tetratricopeptide (TPR) repeat protein